MQTKEKISQVMHIVGNKVSLAGIFYAGHTKGWTEKDLQESRNESIKHLEEWINEKNIKDEDIINFLNKLKDSDWSKKESFRSFQSEIFEPYVKPLLDEQEKIQKELLGGKGNRLK